MEAEENLAKSLAQGWKWILCPGYYRTTVLFKNIQVLDLYEIFQEKSLYMSDYQVEVTIKEYFNCLGRENDNFCIRLQLVSNDDEYLMRFLWESEQQKWKKVVLATKVSLKKVRYMIFIQEIRFRDPITLPGFPFGEYLPRATMKISFPMHQDEDRVQVIPLHFTV